MTYLPRFSDPWVLLLLLIVPWGIFVGVRIRSLASARKWVAVTLRTVIFLSIIFALAGMEIIKRSDRLAVFFLLDHSSSVSEDLRLMSAQWVRNAADTYMGNKDEAGVIVFGTDASVELSVAPKLGRGPASGLGEVLSVVGGEQTDMAGALRLAMAAFPQGYMRRVVLISDGNETLGSILEEVKQAQGDGIAVDVVPLNIAAGEEVRVRAVSAPNQTGTDEPFQLRIVVESEQEADARLHLYQRVGGSRRMLRPQDVHLQKGDNVFLFTQELGQPGFYEYEVRVESDSDTIAANNEGRAFTMVHGEPTVLYVEGNASRSTYLEPALLSEGVRVKRIDPLSMPSSPAQLQNYDAVILSDVSSTDLSTDQMQVLEAMVRDQGIGLVMIGGPDSFGAGGYMDTPVERALPVDMDIKQRKILPRGALVTILHTCEFPDGNAWARDIALASLNVLSSQDLMGCVGYMYNTGDSWIFDLQPVGDRSKMRGLITSGSTQIGDMPAMGPSMQMAYNALKNADAAVKRVVLISDGDPGAPSASLISAYVAEKISVSTICINPHSGSDESMLEGVAQATGGRYYFVSDPRNLPQIFTKEAMVVKRGVLIEKEFTPAMRHDSELLLGLANAPMPPLRGYVVTTPKENATIPLVSHEGDPVLAHWRYGLGKSVAFTSDVTNRWAADWLGWEGFNRFWAQTVRWAVREVTPSTFAVETKLIDGKGHVRIDAVDENGAFINFLRPKGIVTSPEFEREELELTQTGPGIYEASFDTEGSGVYMVNLMYQTPDGTTGTIPTGLAVDYSREYEYNTSNLPLLEQMASIGGGRMLESGSNPFQHDLVASATVTPLWRYLLILAACLLPIEIFVRRVVIPLYVFYDPILRAMRWVPGLGRLLRGPLLRPAAVTGAYRAVTGSLPVKGEVANESFGTRVRGVVVKRAVSAPGEDGEALVPEAPGHSSYTQKLLAAKDRAQREHMGKIDDDEDQES